VVNSIDMIKLLLTHPKMKSVFAEFATAHLQCESAVVQLVALAVEAATDPSQGQKMLQQGFSGEIMCHDENDMVGERVLERSVMCGDDGPQVNFSIAEQTVEIDMSQIKGNHSISLVQIEDETNVMLAGTFKNIDDGLNKVLAEANSSQPNEDIMQAREDILAAREMEFGEMQRQVYAKRRQNLIIRIRSFVAGGLRRLGCVKEQTTLKYLGVTSFDTVIKHIETKMHNYNIEHPEDTQMSLENMQLDHIKPVQRFALDMNHYTNLQPMLAKDNMSKGASWSSTDETFWKANIQHKADFTQIYTPHTPLSKKPRVSCSRADKPEVVPKNIIWNNGTLSWRKRIRKVSGYKGGYKSIAEAQEGLALFCSEMNVGT